MMPAIRDANGNEYFCGLVQPNGAPENFVSAAPRFDAATGLFSDDEIQSIVSNPSRTPAAEIFDVHWVVEGDQKSHNSCAGWGGANALSKTRWKTGIRDGVVFSGSYIYSWCNRNRDQGAVLEEVMAELMSHGTVPASQCGVDTIYRSQTARFDDEAAKVKGLALYSVKTQAEVNTALARGQIVVVCVQVDTTRYVNYNGNGLVPAFNGIGNHCIHVDDIRIVNGVYQYRQVGNWGKGWGNQGTGWCTWSSFAQPIKNHSFYVLTSINDLAV